MMKSTGVVVRDGRSERGAQSDDDDEGQLLRRAAPYDARGFVVSSTIHSAAGRPALRKIEDRMCEEARAFAEVVRTVGGGASRVGEGQG